ASLAFGLTVPGTFSRTDHVASCDRFASQWNVTATSGNIYALLKRVNRRHISFMPPSRVLERMRLMRKLFLPAVACTLWLMFTGSAAAAITYTLNVPVGAGSVTGTITTDGFIGSLFAVDITSFSLQLNDPSSPPPAIL